MGSEPRPPDHDRVGHELDLIAAELASRPSEAIAALHQLIANRLFAFAYGIVRDREEAEDCVQQAFLELIRTASPPSHGYSLLAWMFTSVRYTGLDVLRRRERRPGAPVSDVPETLYEDRYGLGLDPEVEAALAELTEQQRTIVHLKHVEGLDGNDIARIVGLSRGAVYAAASRSERRLRERLSRYISPGGFEGRCAGA